jgi:hypothetical protein
VSLWVRAGQARQHLLHRRPPRFDHAGGEPIQSRFADIRGDEAGLVAFLRRSGEAAAERAETTMKEVRAAVGTW